MTLKYATPILKSEAEKQRVAEERRKRIAELQKDIDTDYQLRPWTKGLGWDVNKPVSENFADNISQIYQTVTQRFVRQPELAAIPSITNPALLLTAPLMRLAAGDDVSRYQGIDVKEQPYTRKALEVVSEFVGGPVDLVMWGIDSQQKLLLHGDTSGYEQLPKIGLGILQSINIFDPNIDDPERFKRAVNALLIVPAVTHGGVTGVKKFKAGKALKEAGYSAAEAKQIVKVTQAGLRELAKEGTIGQRLQTGIKNYFDMNVLKDASKAFGEGVWLQRQYAPEGMPADYIGGMSDFLGARPKYSTADINPIEAPPLPQIFRVLDDAAAPEVFVDGPLSGALDQPDWIPPSRKETWKPGMRIAPVEREPIAKPENPDHIADDFMKELNFGRIVRGPIKGNKIGNYSLESKGVFVKYEGDLSTLFHEVGHKLYDVLGLKETFLSSDDLITDMMVPELRHTINKNMTRATKVHEAFAEAFRAYMINPEQLKTTAPKTYSAIEAALDAQPKVKEVVTKYAEKTIDFMNSKSPSRLDASVHYNPYAFKKQTLGQMVTDAIEGRGDIWKYLKDSFMSNWVDDLNGLERIVKEITQTKGETLAPSNNPFILAETMRYVSRRVTNVLSDGLIDGKGNRKYMEVRDPATGQTTKAPMSIDTIYNVLDNSSPEMFEADVRDMNALGIAERSLELAERIIRDAKTEGGTNAYVDLVNEHMELDAGVPTKQLLQKIVEQGELKGINEALERLAKEAGPIEAGFYDAFQAYYDVLKELHKNPERFHRLVEGVSRYRKYSDGLLDYLVEKGRISADDKIKINLNNQFYYDLSREMDLGEAFSTVPKTYAQRLTKATEVLKRAKGSTKTVSDPVVNLIENTSQIIREADRNEVMSALSDLVDDPLGQFRDTPVDLSRFGVRVSEKGPNTYTVYKNGKEVHYKFSREVTEAIDTIGSYLGGASNVVSKVAQALATTLRTTVTNVPAFQIRNIIRDTQTRVLIGDSGLADFKGAEALRSDYELFGGGYGISEDVPNTRAGYYRAQSKVISQLTSQPDNVIVLGHKQWKRLTNRLETMNRLAEYKKAYAKGKEIYGNDYDAKLYAAKKSRELIDFARGGRTARLVNRYVPFTNAGIQGMSAVYNKWAKAMEHGKKTGDWTAARKLGANLALKATLPVVAEYVWNLSQGEEHMDELRNQPDYIRDTFYNFKVGGVWIRVPKSYEYAAFTGGVHRALDATFGGEGTKAFDGYGPSAGKTLLPFAPEAVAGGPVRPIVENVANYNFFLGSQIVPGFENDLALEKRDVSKASGIGKALQGMFKVDARKIDHWINNQFGGFGRIATTPGRENQTFTPARYTNMLTGMAMDTPGFNAKDVQYVLNAASNVGQRNPLQRYFEAVSSAESTAEYEKAKTDLVQAAGRLRTMIEKASEGKRGQERLDSIEKVLRGGRPKPIEPVKKSRIKPAPWEFLSD